MAADGDGNDREVAPLTDSPVPVDKESLGKGFPLEIPNPKPQLPTNSQLRNPGGSHDASTETARHRRNVYRIPVLRGIRSNDNQARDSRVKALPLITSIE